MTTRASLAAVLAVGLLAFGTSCRHDDGYEVRIVPRGEQRPEGSWQSEPYGVVADNCRTEAGTVLFHRPPATVHEALFTCYRHSGDQREIFVTLRLPDEPWRRAGWSRCTLAREEAIAAMPWCTGVASLDR